MIKKILILPSILFFLILSVFFYLLTIDRNPSEIPSNLLNKSVPIFEAKYLFKNGKIAIDWCVYGIPETFIVNSNGIIKYRHVGPITKKIYKKINLIINENQ